MTGGDSLKFSRKRKNVQQMEYIISRCERGTPMGKDLTNPGDSEYGSIPEPVLHPLMILMKGELATGSALPRENYNVGTSLTISHLVMGVSLSSVGC